MRRRVVVGGHVQGVFFRASTRDVAQRHAVTGWVRNTADGSVEAELEGPPDAVDAVVGWMRRGPDQARVEDVHVTDLADEGGRGFEVR